MIFRYLAIGLLLGGAAAVGVMYFLMDSRTDDDRPPIIVRNGSVILEQTPVRGRAMYPTWVVDGSEYRPDHANGASVSGFLVAVVNPASGTCEGWTGNVVQVSRKTGPPLMFVIAGGHPKVGPAGQLQPDSANARKLSSESAMDQVRVVDSSGGAQTCPLGGSSEVWIWPQR